MARFEPGGKVDVIHRSFPLSDGFPVGSTISVREATLRKYGLTGARLEASIRQIEAMAEQEGLHSYRVLENQVGNTRLAHEFLAHASAEGKNRVAWDAIFRAYFGQARPIFGLDDLLGLADEIGLEREKTRRVLTEGRFGQQVQDDVESAQRLGPPARRTSERDPPHRSRPRQRRGALRPGRLRRSRLIDKPDLHACRALACSGGHDTEEI